MTLRPATPEDAELIYQIKREAYSTYAIRSRGFWDEAFQRRYTSENLPLTQLLQLEDKTIGWIAVKSDADTIEILDLHILPSHQRRGIGTATLRRILDEAAILKKKVTLGVLKINPSRSLYERLGFSVHGETESHWLMTSSGRESRLSA